MSGALLRIASGFLGPLLFALSLVVLWRGHNLPGGGFIGGLLGSAALMLRALVFGWADTLRVMPAHPRAIMTAGLTIAFASGLFGLLLGEPYMQGCWLPAWELPLIGKIKLGTPLLFDLGVYLTVAGFASSCASSLGQEDEKWS